MAFTISPGNTGDGYVMAYRAGAELSGFEYTLVYYIIKDINAPLLYITLTRGAHLLNAFAQEFQENHPGIHLMHSSIWRCVAPCGSTCAI